MPRRQQTDGASETANESDADDGFSRRGILGGLGAAAVAAGLPVAVSPASADGGSSADEPSDVDILNFALTLEHLEYAFYRDSLERFDEQAFRRSDVLTETNPRVRSEVRDFLGVVRDHEKAHVDYLAAAIDDAGGDPVAEAQEYNFGAPLGKDGLDSVVDFTRVAAILEATGVDAYAGAAPLIDTAAYIPPALSIHSVEANHAAYLRTLNGDSPFPTAFNEAKSIGDVLDAVGPIIVTQSSGPTPRT